MLHAILLAAALDVQSPSPSPSAVPTAPAVNTELEATPAPEPTRRALPAPLDPIFTGGGGADFLGPTIGVPSDHGIRVYGWLDPGLELSTSKQSNFPLTYNDVPNHFQMDQAVLRIERQPDTVQTDHFDWGFRLSNIYGVDYRWTTAQGWFSNQLLLRNQTNGYDLPEAYGIAYFPRWAKGTILQVGRYISPPDIEAQLATSNFLYSHSLMFSFDCYTQTGFLFSTKLSDYWTVQYGLHSGDDIAPWDGSQHWPTLVLMGRWISHSNRDSILFGIDSLALGTHNGQSFTTWTKGTYINASTGQVLPLTWGHDNLQQQNVTWTHVFNSGFVNFFEAYYLYQNNAFVGGTINNYNVATGGPVYLGAGGGPGAFLPGTSTATGFVDYLVYKTGSRDFLVFRPDYVNDPSGERSGFATAYGSLTLGWTHRFSSVLMIRPEVRSEKAWRAGVTPYDNGTKNYQTEFGIDAILNFGNP